MSGYSYDLWPCLAGTLNQPVDTFQDIDGLNDLASNPRADPVFRWIPPQPFQHSASSNVSPATVCPSYLSLQDPSMGVAQDFQAITQLALTKPENTLPLDMPVQQGGSVSQHFRPPIEAASGYVLAQHGHSSSQILITLSIGDEVQTLPINNKVPNRTQVRHPRQPLPTRPAPRAATSAAVPTTESALDSAQEPMDITDNKRPCPVCKKLFNPKPSNWKRHLETHTDLKRFECLYLGCGARKRTKDQAVIHFVTKHLGMKIGKDVRPSAEQRTVAEEYVFEHH